MEGDGASSGGEWADEWGGTGTWPDDPLAPLPDHIFDPAPLIFALLDAARAVTLAIDMYGTASPMTPAQTRIAAFLARGTGQPPVNIAEYLGVSSAAVTQMLKRMHTLGTVRFDEHPRDGRCRLVLLTRRGRELMQANTARLQRHDNRLAAHLGPSLARDMLPALRDVAMHFEYPPDMWGPTVRRPIYEHVPASIQRDAWLT